MATKKEKLERINRHYDLRTLQRLEHIRGFAEKCIKQPKLLIQLKAV